MYATRLCVYNKHIVIYINITLHVNNKTAFQIHENTNNKYILVFIKYYKLQWIMVVNTNGVHIVKLGVDKGVHCCSSLQQLERHHFPNCSTIAS